MSVPGYQRYKDSGVEWLGEVPEHWQMRALKTLVATPITDGPHETPDFVAEGIPFVSAESVSAGHLDFRKIRGFISLTDHEVYAKKYLPQREDIFMVKSGATTGVTAIVETDEPFSIWSPLAAIRCNCDILPRFMLQFLRSANFLDAIALNWSFGTQQNIGMGVIENLPIPRPPIEEQVGIASFLHCETAKIDALIQEQQRLIELLKEKRQAVISHAVTKGLDPVALMKDAGCEWLGVVPDHWHVVRIGSSFRNTQECGEEGLPILSVSIHSGVSDRQLDDSEVERTVIRSEDVTKYKRVLPGDLTYNMMRAWQGGFGTVTSKGMVSPAYIVARPRSIRCAAFVEQLLRTPSAIEEMRRHSKGVTDFRLRLYWEDFKNIVIGVPPPDEIELITAALAQKQRESDELIELSQRAIAFLQERRAALISAAVTGKIDVRNYCPRDTPTLEELCATA